MEPQDENGVLLIVIVVLAGLVYSIYRLLRGPRK